VGRKIIIIFPPSPILYDHKKFKTSLAMCFWRVILYMLLSQLSSHSFCVIKFICSFPNSILRCNGMLFASKRTVLIKKKITSFLIQNYSEQIPQKEHVRFIMAFNSLWALQGSIHWNFYSHIILLEDVLLITLEW